MNKDRMKKNSGECLPVLRTRAAVKEMGRI